MPRHNACDDFHRTSEAVRRDFLGGAPLTRRQVLAGGLGAGLTLYTAQALPVTRVFEAAAADAAAAPNAPVLVSVFLPGGVDLLDTLVPAARLRALRGPPQGAEGGERAAGRAAPGSASTRRCRAAWAAA